MGADFNEQCLLGLSVVVVQFSLSDVYANRVAVFVRSCRYSLMPSRQMAVVSMSCSRVYYWNDHGHES